MVTIKFGQQSSPLKPNLDLVLRQLQIHPALYTSRLWRLLKL